MLIALHIEHVAIVAQLDIEFHSGLNVLTGETGAGKSIIVGAIGLVLGARASTDLIRKGVDTAVCEARFLVNCSLADILRSEIPELHDEFEDGGEFCLRRELHRKGGSRCFINDRLITVQELRQLGRHLGLLCSQHQHHQLLDTRSHIRVLDEWAALSEKSEQFALMFHALRTDCESHARLQRQSAERQQADELAQFQIAEIKAAGLQPDEEDSLKAEQKRIRHAQRIIEAIQQTEQVLLEGEDSASDRITTCAKELNDLAEIDSRLHAGIEYLDTAAAQLQETVTTLRELLREYDIDPRRAEEVEERLAEIFRLKQKYGPSCQAVLERLAELESSVEQYSQADEELAALAERIEQQKEAVADDATKLQKHRAKAAKSLETSMARALNALGMTGAKWTVQFSPVTGGGIQVPVDGNMVSVNETGFYEVEFIIETNPGEGFKPLAKIASGGELSRVMLALKGIAPGRQDVATLVFDEVDSGIGGQVAYAVGEQLAALTKRYQVLLITHLPQMIGGADRHFSIRKTKRKGRMITEIDLLDEEGRVAEVARMMAAEKITDTTRAHAASLVSSGEKKKRK